jgi:hypothetical protein
MVVRWLGFEETHTASKIKLNMTETKSNISSQSPLRQPNEGWEERLLLLGDSKFK